ncbi:hypothetical protein ISF_06066 [Cordyceps fumosorosea ARSEF 2679]|uniref:Uncharacterized protein n=1 Tax=Cordyceps fumosorosea (strain ARSEF 2679) TaxID=1081104 RepID=A0A167SY65_CORFA|nr:hypothetical protein ISF_06066 [Cordyceps fumosorosea ARSEF 2679]OAA60055.1 hypothetical protein ISF_06066 [Cordyceps fumosorosea ARSEF 2679]
MPLYTSPPPERDLLTRRLRNERQRARNRPRSSSASQRTETVVECTIITVILRRPSQQYGTTQAPTRAPGSPPSYEDVFQWEAETSVAENRPQQQQQQQQRETNATPRRGAATATLPIHIKKA